jgi:hypothetical protein
MYAALYEERPDMASAGAASSVFFRLRHVETGREVSMEFAGDWMMNERSNRWLSSGERISAKFDITQFYELSPGGYTLQAVYYHAAIENSHAPPRQRAWSGYLRSGEVVFQVR